MESHGVDLLSQSDEDLFSKGGCHVFAICLAEIFHYPIRILRNTTEPIPRGIVHIYCCPATDVMIDFFGRGNECCYLRERHYNFPPYRAEAISVSDLENYHTETFGTGGLYVEPCFLESAKQRALRVIEGSRQKYRYP